MYHFPKSAFEENVKSRKERKRERKQNRKSSAKQDRDENNLCGTFPVLVEPKLTRHRSRRRHVSTESSPSPTAAETPDISDCDEYFGTACANRENNGARVKQSSKNSEESTRPRRPRKKKKRGSKVEDEVTPYVPTFADKPPSRNGAGFHLDNSSYRNSALMPKKRSLENLFGLRKGHRDTPPPPPRGFDLPIVRERSGRMNLKPHKLPPIEQAKRKQP